MKKFALVIGVSSYSDQEISDLSFAARDAREVGGCLADVCGFDDVRTLASGGQREPDHTNIVQALHNLAPLLSRDDLFLFYFAGHGIETKKGACLLTSNSLIRMPELASISKEVLSDCLSRIECANRVLILDACRNDPNSGRGDEDNVLTSEFSRDIMAVAETAIEGIVPVTCVLFSCRQGERAYEWPDKGHGAFTYYLLEGLRGAAADNHGRVTVQSLGCYVEEKVPRWAQKMRTPRPQTPWSEQNGSLRDVLLAARTACPSTATAAASVSSPEEPGASVDARIPCPACGRSLRVAKKFAGQSLPCPVCKALLRVSINGGDLTIAVNDSIRDASATRRSRPSTRQGLGCDFCSGAVATVIDGSPRILRRPTETSLSQAWELRPNDHQLLEAIYSALSPDGENDVVVLGVPIGLRHFDRCRLRSAARCSCIRLVEALILAAVAHIFCDRRRGWLELARPAQRCGNFHGLALRHFRDYDEAVVFKWAEGVFCVVATSFQGTHDASAQGERLATVIRGALRNAKLEKVDRVLIVQGNEAVLESSIQTVLPAPTPTIHRLTSEDVAYGGAIQAMVLSGEEKNLLILTVLPYSISIETSGGVATRMIDRDTIIPTERKQIFSTTEDGQTAVTVLVYAGEHERAKDNTLLGAVRLHGLPARPKGTTQIEVAVDCNVEGIVKVTAKDLAGGLTSSVTLDGSGDTEAVSHVPPREALAPDDKAEESK